MNIKQLIFILLISKSFISFCAFENELNELAENAGKSWQIFKESFSKEAEKALVRIGRSSSLAFCGQLPDQDELDTQEQDKEVEPLLPDMTGSLKIPSDEGTSSCKFENQYKEYKADDKTSDEEYIEVEKPQPDEQLKSRSWLFWMNRKQR